MTQTKSGAARKPSTPSDQMLAYYGFWYWEYQRRNKQYIEDYNHLMQVTNGRYESPWVLIDIGLSTVRIPHEFQDEYRPFISAHNRLPKDPTKGVSPEDIITDCANKSMIYEYDDIFDIDALTHKQITNAVSYKKIPCAVESTGNNEDIVWSNCTPSICNVVIDFNAPLDLLQKRIKYIYYEQRSATSAKNFFQPIPSATKEKNEITEDLKMDKAEELEIQKNTKLMEKAYIDLMDCCRKDLVKNMKVDNGLARAVGLWIYDNIVDYKRFDTDGSEIYGANIYADELIESHFPEFRLKDYHKRTIQCIKQVAVLSLDDKKNLKKKSCSSIEEPEE